MEIAACAHPMPCVLIRTHEQARAEEAEAGAAALDEEASGLRDQLLGHKVHPSTAFYGLWFMCTLGHKVHPSTAF